ncbi:ArsR/SmtB family transcription factor [Kitasatospora azatica]|uniref:ArsR/SmtB family transcription factor n=1 Tax=Kitasatospora azatica TaxID=58347 RepID=UPI00056B9658|nr:helix-turn-helix domain-containing protein [Kitasatospora azatica]
MQERSEERLVDDVATLKALADPVRLAILDALVRHDPQPLTAKELAVELDEPQTKLYRHLKQLEKAELIGVAGTRLVSGIVESRYQVRQKELRLASAIFAAGSPERPEALGAMLAALDSFRHTFERDFLADRIDFASPPSGAPGVFAHSVFRVSPERAARLRARLREVLAEAAQAEEGEESGETVDVKLFTLMYTERS